MENTSWGELLAHDYKQKTGSHRRIQLPAQDHIRYDGGMDRVTALMQAESHSFEPTADTVDARLLGSLLFGSIPAVALASRVSAHVPDILLRFVLATTLAVIEIRVRAD